MTFSAVIFDWRGTLVTTLTWQQWAKETLHRRTYFEVFNDAVAPLVSSHGYRLAPDRP
jgi:beta-phosphoglucomutase-like phosphatase (HAD superfamily)